MTLFSANFFVSKLDFDHGMMTCRDMFDMFSLTCLSCDMGRGTFSAYFVDFDHGIMTCRDMFSLTCLSCDMGVAKNVV